MLLLAGYSWVAFSMFRAVSVAPEGVELCIFKIVTGVPCPACGSTRAVVSIFKGDLHQAILLNPIGFIIVITMLVLPFWLLADLIFKEKSLLNFYLWFEKIVVNRKVMITAIILLLANWIWNIYKAFS